MPIIMPIIILLFFVLNILLLSDRGKDAAGHCDSDSTTEISNKRAAPWINSTLWDDAVLARKLGVRLIYRNSHYNVRYGVNCADDQVMSVSNDILAVPQSRSKYCVYTYK